MAGPVSVNFAWLVVHEPLLDEYGGAAEAYLARDPNTALMKLRQFGEVLVQQVAVETGAWRSGDETFADLTVRLQRERLLPQRIANLLHGLRRDGNDAVHHHVDECARALHQLKMAYQLGIWFHRSFGDTAGWTPAAFVPPRDFHPASVREELEQLRAQLEASRAEIETARALAEAEQRRRLQAEQDATRAHQEREVWELLAEEAERNQPVRTAELEARQHEAEQLEAAELEATVAQAHEAAEHVELDEFDTRREIDAQLRAAGWEADTASLRWSQGTRPRRGCNQAIAEWPVRGGRADYVLFVGLTPVAIVEAKRNIQHVAGALDQAARYSRSYESTDEETLPTGSPWGDADTAWRPFVVPFLFATNGRPYLRQLVEHSGIWFRDARRPTHLPRALDGWYTPDGLVALLGQDIEAADRDLADSPSDYLPLRDYQREAIAAVESAIADGRRNILLSMATGTGKTRTAICLLYRLLRSQRFRRVLFLVDRTALGEQAGLALEHVQLEQLQSFTNIYDVCGLDDSEPDDDTRLHIATIQSLVHRVFDEDTTVPVDLYDCIVVDECHRGYNLDQELSDVELTFRDESDYVSKYQRVLDHFDAVRIGLTATPAAHTVALFGRPVFNYSYRRAVIDGYLVDHEPPIRIVTDLLEDGIQIAYGEVVTVVDARTGEVSEEIAEDDVDIEVDWFNTRVVTEGFNRAVCQELARYIDPTLDEKTLVFCARDDHADLVVRLLREAFAEHYGEVESDAVRKITGSVDRPSEAIRFYKNERLPSVAVTVDLLTTGIDVPRIANLVFIRRVRSRILYEQMLGRATRLCPEIGKESFRIFDAVNLYAALQHVSTMQPVVTRPTVTFAQLAAELATVEDEAARELVADQLLARLQRWRHRLTDADDLDRLATLTGGHDLEALLATLREQTPEETRDWLAAHGALPRFLDRVGLARGDRRIVHEGAGEVRRVERGYGEGITRPEDYLEAFGQWLDQHNQLPAVIAAVQRPRDLTRASLRELQLALDEDGYSLTHLRTAWRDMTNADIAASIIGFIRQRALGSPLVPYAERVDRAVASILAERAFTAPQRQWLERIACQLRANLVVTRDDLDAGEFAQNGGFRRLDRVFGGQLEALLAELGDRVWQDAANAEREVVEDGVG